MARMPAPRPPGVPARGLVPARGPGVRIPVGVVARVAGVVVRVHGGQRARGGRRAGAAGAGTAAWQLRVMDCPG